MPGFNIPDVREPCDPGSAPGSAFNGPTYAVETARRHRYVIDILEALEATESDDSIRLYLSKCTRPSPEFDNMIVHSGTDQINRPGKIKWNPVEFTFYEVVESDTDSITEFLYKWWSTFIYNLNSSSHYDINRMYKDAQLSMLNGVGDPIWTYNLIQCYPSKVTPSELSYADSEIAETTVTLQVNKVTEINRARGSAP